MGGGIELDELTGGFVDDDDGIGGLGDDGGEDFLLFAEGFFGAFTFGDIAGDKLDTGLAVEVGGRGDDFDVDVGAVRAAVADFGGVDGFIAGVAFLDTVFGVGHVIGVDEFFGAAADHLFTGGGTEEL